MANTLIQNDTVLRTVKTTRKDGLVVPDGEAPRFPIDVLPEPFGSFVHQGARCFPCSPDSIAVPLLVMAGSAVGFTRVIKVKQDWEETPRLWAAFMARAGMMKSPVLNKVAANHYRREIAKRKEFLEELREWKKEIESGKTIEEVGPRPIRERVIISDATVEKLIVLLEENPRGLLLLADELSGWFSSIGQYKSSGKSNDWQHLMSIWSHKPTIVDRLGREGNLAERPFLSLIGGIQPEVFDQIARKRGYADGGLDRIVVCQPDEVTIAYTENTISPQIERRVAVRFAQLFALKFQPFYDQPSTDPVRLRFTPEAKCYFIDWYNSHCREMQSDLTPQYLHGAYAKLCGYVPTLALILALMKNPNAKVVDVDATLGGISLAEDYFKVNVRRIYGRIFDGNQTRSDDLMTRCTRSIVDALQRSPLPRRQLQQKISGRYTSETFASALSFLCEANEIRELRSGGSIKYGLVFPQGR